MNGDIGWWRYGLLFSALSVVLGIVGLVSARRASERWLTGGLFLQGVLLTFVIGGAFIQGTSDPKLGGLVIAGLLIVHSVWSPNSNADEKPIDEDDPS